jgi:hypothetical protein
MSRQLKSIGRTGAKLMRVEITDALKSIAENYGLAFELGRITFDDNSFKVSVEAALVSEAGEPKMAIDFRKHCYKYGLKESDLGSIFKNASLERFEITGAKPRNRKYPIIAKKLSNGKEYKFTILSVTMGLER